MFQTQYIIAEWFVTETRKNVENNILTVRCVKVSFSIKIVTKCSDISHDEVITVSIRLHVPDTINYCKLVCDQNKKKTSKLIFLTVRCVKVSFSIKIVTKCSDTCVLTLCHNLYT